MVFPFRVSYDWSTIIDSPLQTGFGASSRQFKKAVHRNRIKRLTREAYRLQKNELQTIVEQSGKKLAVFIVYVGKELPDYNIVSEKIAVILTRLTSIVHEASSANT